MKSASSALILASLLAASICGGQSLPSDDSRIAALGSRNSQDRTSASQELIGVGAPVIPPLVSVLDKARDERTAAKMADQTLFRMAQAYAGTDRAAEIEAALVRELRSQHPVETKRRICVVLSYIAEQNPSIDTLYVCLNEPELAAAGIWALANAPIRRSSQCLMGALQLTEGNNKIAVVAALGLRGDPAGASYLAPGIYERQPELHQAVLEALARIPAPASFEALAAAYKENQPGAASAMIGLMETLLDAGLDQAAELVLQAMGDKPALSVPEKCRLLHACGRLGNKSSVDSVLAALKDDNPRIRAAAVQACGLFPSKDLTTTVAEQMTQTGGSLRIDLLEVLGRRGQWMNDAAAERIIAAVGGPEQAVQVAAIGAIEAAGIDAGVPVLLKTLAGPAGAARDAAEGALNHMPGPAASAAIAKSLDGASPEVRVRLLGALARRGDTSVVPAVIQATRTTDETVRLAALRALGLLQAESGLDTLLAAMQSSSAAEREMAVKAAQRLQGDSVTQRLLAAYKEMPRQHKAALLRMIGGRKHAEVPALLAAAAESADTDIRAAAIEGLGRQDDPAIAPRLLEVARKGPAGVTEAAVGGCLNAAKRLEGTDREAAGRMYVDIIPLAVTDEQKRQSLAGIAQCADSPPASLLPMVMSWLQDHEKSAPAVRVATRIAVGLPESRKSEAIQVLQQVLTGRPDPETTAMAAEHLRRLGVDIDPARQAGFITQWWLLGPLPNTRNEMWDKSYDPERKVDLRQTIKIGDKELRWRPYHTQGLEGVMNMDRALGPDEYVGAYAYAEIVVDSAQEVLLKIGSDDSLVVWANGKKVYAFNGARGVKVDEDTAKAQLQAGVNRVLVKSLDQVNDWAFCIRATTPEGKPIALKQKTE